MPESTTRRAARTGDYVRAFCMVGVGVLLLVMGATRKYQDLQRLYLLGVGYLFTGAGGLTALVLAVPRGRRVLVSSVIAIGAAVAIIVGVLVTE